MWNRDLDGPFVEVGASTIASILLGTMDRGIVTVESPRVPTCRIRKLWLTFIHFHWLTAREAPWLEPPVHVLYNAAGPCLKHCPLV